MLGSTPPRARASRPSFIRLHQRRRRSRGERGPLERPSSRTRRGAADAETKATKGANYEVARVSIGGTYTDPFSKAGPQADYRLLGAIVTNDHSAYFVKLIGPEKTVGAAEADFDALLKS